MGGIQTPYIIDMVCESIKQYAQTLDTVLNDKDNTKRQQEEKDLRAVIDSLAFCIHDDC